MFNHAPVLIAEDDANDVFLLRRAFQKLGLTHPLVVFHNGQEAIDYLSTNGDDANQASTPPPALLFLDLKMPMLDGFDVLSWLQERPPGEKLPIIVLTSSNQEKDVQRALQMGADEYHVKPQQFEELMEIVNKVQQRWLKGQTEGNGP